MTSNIYKRLQALRPLPPVLVGIVREIHPDFTSTVEIPGNLPLTGYGDGSTATGSLIRPRGNHIPVGKKAFVRAGRIETQAPDGDAIDIPIGTVIMPTPAAAVVIGFIRITAVGAFQAYNQRTYNLSVKLRRRADSVYEALRFTGQNSATHNTFNPNALGDPSSTIYWGDLDGGTVNARDTNWDVAAAHSLTIPVMPTTSGGKEPNNDLFDGMYCDFTLEAWAGGTSIWTGTAIRIEVLDTTSAVMIDKSYLSTDPSYFRGTRVAPSTGDPFDAALV